VFREFAGLPAHALVVHAAVVFIPLAALAAILYAVWPALRKHIWWAVLGLGVLAPIVGWVARLSGAEYKKYWVANGAGGEFLDQINKHEAYGNTTALWATALGVIMLAMVLYAIPRSGPPLTRLAGLITSVLTVVVALVTLYYVILTGDAGAHASHVEL
jgi:hypothetical protein